MKLPPSTDRASALSWMLLRVLLACLIAAHGWSRFLHGGVEPFGEWLGSQGIPLGFAIAAGITALEILATPLLAYGVFVLPLCLLHSAIYLVGIAMVHWPAGWFVVGAGRNGMEYSVLLVACLLLVGFRHRAGAPPPA